MILRYRERTPLTLTLDLRPFRKCLCQESVGVIWSRIKLAMCHYSRCVATLQATM